MVLVRSPLTTIDAYMPTSHARTYVLTSRFRYLKLELIPTLKFTWQHQPSEEPVCAHLPCRDLEE